MYCYELYRGIDPSVIEEMFRFFRDHERDIYKTAIKSLAEARKVRPAFVQKKSVADQIAWAHQSLKLKPNSMLGEHLFQVFFLKAHTDMLVDFLDEQEVDHDGQGQIENLPDELDPGKLKAAAETLIDKYGAPLTTAYLHLFNMQRPNGWTALSELLSSDQRFQLQIAE